MRHRRRTAVVGLSLTRRRWSTKRRERLQQSIFGFGEEGVVVDARQIEFALLDSGPKPGRVCGWMRWLTNSPRARAISSASSDLRPEQRCPSRRRASSLCTDLGEET